MDYETAKGIFSSKHEQADARIESFYNSAENWLASLPPPIVPIIVQMISQFDYYSHSETNQMLCQLHRELTERYKLDDHTALHTYIKKKDGRICSSVDYWAEYRLYNQIDKNLCSDDISSIPGKEWELIENIVIIDDCCGTGSSLEKYIKQSKRDFSGKTIFYLVLHALEASLEKIHQIEKTYHLSIHLIAINLRRQAIPIISPDNVEHTREQVILASKEMHINENYTLGKDDSEGLMAFYNNTPNNTIGLFWFPSDVNKPVFPRDFGTVPPWRPSTSEMKEKKAQRKRGNYLAVRHHG